MSGFGLISASNDTVDAPVAALASVLDRIESVKRVKTEHEGAGTIKEDSTASLLLPSAVPEWYEFIDPASGKSYYHNYKTQETSWEKPVSFVPYVVPATTVNAYDAGNYTTTAFFNAQDGRFGGVGTSHWEQKGLPTDRSARQISRFIDLNELQRNRDETKAKKAEIQKQLKGVDWKKYKEEKKELKKRKRYAWMLEE